MKQEMQQTPRSFRSGLYKPSGSQRKEHRILVLQTGIAGMQFHIESEEERERLNNITPGTELMLYRDPENRHDKWAVGVYITEDDMIGYISRFKNETIARLMDAGKKFVAVVDDPEELAAEENEDLQDEEAARRNRRAPTENMKLPFSVYLVETV